MTGIAEIIPFAVVCAAVNRHILSVMSRINSAGPIDKRVARVAGLRESGGLVSRIGGVVVIRLVTAPAIAWSARVVIPHVTEAALVIGQHRGVIAGQLEGRARMGERRPRPVRGGVARRAILRETGGRVRRIGRSVVIRLMAIPAGGARQVEIVVYVALGALKRGMETGQRETGGRMIESSAQPVGGGVAA